MPNQIQLPYYTIKATDLASWIEQQGEMWWFVDGDPLLTSFVNFPCPPDELIKALQKVDKNALIFDPREGITAKGEAMELEQMDDMADKNNNSSARTFLLQWADDDWQWLMMEDPAAAKDAEENAA
ncbi:hypothetical protein [Planctomycetes bacterium TBK1r]|uniref:Uncharacterized protein n=1 Tax=Stieleria magnilauensis TaxID=2527963 RepID=A0ABX5XWX8_9BACT|nr:hypothetical protein TBK1r_48220 [Planctomycetes bacterium TBK1r]